MKKPTLDPDNPHPRARLTVFDPSATEVPLVSPPDRYAPRNPAPDGQLTAEDRAVINRENALRSTGPRTGAGRQRSRLNALRHGLTGQALVVYRDDWDSYCLHSLRQYRGYKPVGANEEDLVQLLVDLSWSVHVSTAYERNARALDVMGPFKRFEDEGHDFGLLEKVVAETGAVRDDCAGSRSLEYLGKIRARDLRAWHRVREQLRIVQNERRARAARLRALQAEHGANYQPEIHGPFDDDGFSLQACPAFDFYMFQLTPRLPVVSAKKTPQPEKSSPRNRS